MLTYITIHVSLQCRFVHSYIISILLRCMFKPDIYIISMNTVWIFLYGIIITNVSSAPLDVLNEVERSVSEDELYTPPRDPDALPPFGDVPYMRYPHERSISDRKRSLVSEEVSDSDGNDPESSRDLHKRKLPSAQNKVDKYATFSVVRNPVPSGGGVKYVFKTANQKAYERAHTTTNKGGPTEYVNGQKVLVRSHRVRSANGNEDIKNSPSGKSALPKVHSSKKDSTVARDDQQDKNGRFSVVRNSVANGAKVKYVVKSPEEKEYERSHSNAKHSGPTKYVNGQKVLLRVHRGRSVNGAKGNKESGVEDVSRDISVEDEDVLKFKDTISDSSRHLIRHQVSPHPLQLRKREESKNYDTRSGEKRRIKKENDSNISASDKNRGSDRRGNSKSDEITAIRDKMNKELDDLSKGLFKWNFDFRSLTDKSMNQLLHSDTRTIKGKGRNHSLFHRISALRNKLNEDFNNLRKGIYNWNIDSKNLNKNSLKEYFNQKQDGRKHRYKNVVVISNSVRSEKISTGFNKNKQHSLVKITKLKLNKKGGDKLKNCKVIKTKIGNDKTQNNPNANVEGVATFIKCEGDGDSKGIMEQIEVNGDKNEIKGTYSPNSDKKGWNIVNKFPKPIRQKNFNFMQGRGSNANIVQKRSSPLNEMRRSLVNDGEGWLVDDSPASKSEDKLELFKSEAEMKKALDPDFKSSKVSSKTNEAQGRDLVSSGKENSAYETRGTQDNVKGSSGEEIEGSDKENDYQENYTNSSDKDINESDKENRIPSSSKETSDNVDDSSNSEKEVQESGDVSNDEDVVRFIVKSKDGSKHEISPLHKAGNIAMGNKQADREDDVISGASSSKHVGDTRNEATDRNTKSEVKPGNKQNGVFRSKKHKEDHEGSRLITRTPVSVVIEDGHGLHYQKINDNPIQNSNYLNFLNHRPSTAGVSSSNFISHRPDKNRHTKNLRRRYHQRKLRPIETDAIGHVSKVQGTVPIVEMGVKGTLVKHIYPSLEDRHASVNVARRAVPPRKGRPSKRRKISTGSKWSLFG